MGNGFRLLLAMPGLALATALPASAAATTFQVGQTNLLTISVFNDRGSAWSLPGSNAGGLWNPSQESAIASPTRRSFWNSSRAFEDPTTRGSLQARQLARHFHFQRFRLMGINGTAPFPMAAFELGSNNRFFGNKLEINAGVFRYRYGGYRLTLPGSRGLIGAAAVLPSLGMTSRTTGAELEAAYKLTARDSLDLNASYMHGRRSSLLNLATDRQITNTDSLQIVPSYEHVVPLRRGQSLSFDAAAIYRSSSRVTTWALGAFDPSVRKLETTRFDASLTFRSSSRLSMAAFVRNITDVHPDKSTTLTTRSLVNPATVSAVLSEPRTYGLMLSARL